MELDLTHRVRMHARVSGLAVSRPCNFATSQNHTLTVSHSQGPENNCPFCEEPIVIIVEPSEKPGCEVIERSEYQETGKSGEALSEARDRGTGYCEES
eukprot:CAMPEP_0172587310 /NCGR_PEP_ID=MMETSP1068-20121228/6381_1 /TAXON_ID=35684 /ORGANISM="Pseudopedinella elastica, Strain CCMP716" /LENGTH=97 /DNA_ID=CAMNT_0013382283 /DNA_START=129 /DNA_END=418 /DNA_ORIENTATION=+